MKNKIGIVTATRAEYGLLYPIIHEIIEDDTFELKLIVTGTHLSSFHGNTISFIEQDNVPISKKIDIDIQDDKESDLAHSLSVGIDRFSKYFSEEKLDLVIILGDRYELWAICMAAVLHKIPIAHIHGGEITKGAIDNVVRHSITKMASIHFPSIELYTKRIIQMGEQPHTVFPVGALGIDNMLNLPMMSKKEIQDFTQVDFTQDVALMTYHPVTVEAYNSAGQQVEEILQALLRTNLFTLITMPNADLGGNQIYKGIIKYVEQYPKKFVLIKSLGQKGYLSAMKYAKLMIGNSSSGIIEAASFNLPVINIGVRQEGRFKPQNVIDCNCKKGEILGAIDKAVSNEFYQSITKLENPYGDGKTAKRIVNILKTIDFDNPSKLLIKDFYDIGIQDKGIMI